MDIFRRIKILKNSAFYAGIAGCILLSSFTACGHTNVTSSNKTTYTSNILNYKTAYVGNNSKVCGIVSELTVPEGITANSVELSTKAKPYGVTVNYTAKNGTDINSTVWEYKNAAIMLSLIGNADNITFKLKNASCEKYQGFNSEFNFSRGNAEGILGKGINKYSDNDADFKKFMETLGTAKFSVGCINVNYAQKEAEQKFKIASPNKLTYKNRETVCGKECYMFSCGTGDMEYAVSTDGCFYFNLLTNKNKTKQT